VQSLTEIHFFPFRFGTTFGLDIGTPQDGTWNGTVSIPMGIEDGDHYGVAIKAGDEAGNYVESQDLKINIHRGTVPPVSPSEKGKCCDLSININSGPVNIYVYKSENES
jgi:hypothetical protein